MARPDLADNRLHIYIDPGDGGDMAAWPWRSSTERNAYRTEHYDFAWIDRGDGWAVTAWARPEPGERYYVHSGRASGKSELTRQMIEALRPESKEECMDLQYYVVAVRKLYRDYVQRGQGITAEEWYRNECVDRATVRLAQVVLPALGWQRARVTGGKDAVCSVIRNLITRMLLAMPSHASYVGFSEAGIRAMDAFFRRAPDEVLIAAAINALADGDIPEKRQEAWSAFQQTLLSQQLVEAELDKVGTR